MRSRLAERFERDVDDRSRHAELLELPPDRRPEPGGGRPAPVRDDRGAVEDLLTEALDRALQRRDAFVGALERCETIRGPLEEGHDVGVGRPVLAPEPGKRRDPLSHELKPAGIGHERVSIVPNVVCELGDLRREAPRSRAELLRVGVESRGIGDRARGDAERFARSPGAVVADERRLGEGARLEQPLDVAQTRLLGPSRSLSPGAGATASISRTWYASRSSSRSRSRAASRSRSSSAAASRSSSNAAR